MQSNIKHPDIKENNEVGLKTLDTNHKPYSTRSTLNRCQIEKQQTIKSWYPSYHFLIILPEKLAEKNYIGLSHGIRYA
jgi:hypothetical protein